MKYSVQVPNFYFTATVTSSPKCTFLENILKSISTCFEGEKNIFNLLKVAFQSGNIHALAPPPSNLTHLTQLNSSWRHASSHPHFTLCL